MLRAVTILNFFLCDLCIVFIVPSSFKGNGFCVAKRHMAMTLRERGKGDCEFES